MVYILMDCSDIIIHRSYRSAEVAVLPGFDAFGEFVEPGVFYARQQLVCDYDI